MSCRCSECLQAYQPEKLFTREYLGLLQRKCENNFNVIDYTMKSDGLNFHDAVLKLSKYFQIKPEYT